MPIRKVTLITRLILERRGSILFLAQTTKNGGKYSLVGGKTESEEMATSSLIRETFEEIGVIINVEHLKMVHVLQRQKENETMIVLYFRASEWSGEITAKETKKFKRVQWCAINELPKSISRITKKVLSNYTKGYLFTEWDERKIIAIA